MCAPVMIGLMIASAAMSAKAQQDQGEATNKIAQNNAKMAEYAADDAKMRGEQEAQAVQRKAASLKSTQRVGMAANGLDLGYGSAADIQDQTDFFAQSDAATARTNAGREAWRGAAQAQDFRSQGSAASANGAMGAFSTLLSGAGMVADKWNTGKKPPVKTTA